jgi:hypothetical protein
MSQAAVDAISEDVASTENAAGAAPGISAPTFTEHVRESALLSLGVASLAGFIFGGGASSRTGAAMLMLIGRMWLRRTATDALASAITRYGTAKRNGPG